MTRKPNFVKFILGTVVLALVFVGTWAATSARLTSAKKSAVLPTVVSNSSNLVSRYAAPLATPTPGGDSIFAVFELDGDITDTAPGSIPDDWSTVNCGGGNAVAETGVLFDGLGNSIFTGGGSKDNDLLSSWQHKDGSVPPKDEILNAYAAKYTGATGDDILIFGADRYAINGTAFIGIWFFQQPVFAVEEDGKFHTGPLVTDPLAEHEVGDVLVLVEFTGGGSIPTAKVFEWVGTGGSEAGGTLNDITLTAPAGSVFAISNSLPQTITSCPGWVHTPKTGPDQTIQVNAFFEGGINLDAFPALSNTCFSSLLVETRSSAVVTATLKDFVLGQFDTCPNVSITKTADDDDVCAGDDTTYTYTVTNPGPPLTGTVIDDNETPSNTSDDLDVTASCAPIGAGSAATVPIPTGDTVFQCTRTLSAGTHTNIVTVVAGAGGFSSTATATETVVVNANPDVRISTVTCFDNSSFLTASDANSTPGVTFTWTGAGGASTTGTTRTITGTGSYTVTATSGECTDSATRIVSFCSDAIDAP
jgi:hypothetical protein